MDSKSLALAPVSSVLIGETPSFVQSCASATVQDFLEKYEVGETVGVGGELRCRTSVLLPSYRIKTGWTHRRPTASPPASLHAALSRS
jgi:hypothetical protein